EAESVMFLKQNLFKFDLKYFRPLGNPYKFIQGMLQHFSRLKDEDVTPEQYMSFAQQVARGAWRVENQKEKKLRATSYELRADEHETLKTLELANAYQTYEELKIQEGLL